HVRRDPRDSTASRAGPQGPRARPPGPRPGGGGVRDLRPAPCGGPGRPRRAPRSAGRPRVLEEPEGPPPRMRRDPSEGSERPDELDGEKVRARGPRATGG